jgi:hypothetical protein
LLYIKKAQALSVAKVQKKLQKCKKNAYFFDEKSPLREMTGRGILL